MKVLDIALKDLLRSFRSRFALVMMFVVPLLITGIMQFAFGRLGGDGGFDLPVTRVRVANLDRPGPQFSFSFGQMLVGFLQDERLVDLLEVAEADDEGSARTAVEDQDAGVAVIIPANFTTAALEPAASAEVTLYQDPTLTLGPGIVKGIIRQFVDGFSGAKIAANVVADQLGQRGVAMDVSLRQDVVTRYAAWSEELGQSWGEGAHPALDIQPPPSKAEAVSTPEAVPTSEPAGQGAGMMGPIMAGMLIFFTFFTGANTAETIIREDEEGTLARLFTTPTLRTAILGGKFTAIFITLVVQVLVLMLVSMIIFDIRWGEPLTVALAALGLVVVAAGFGVLLMSFIKSTRQAGPVVGAALTLSGMLGGLFTTGFQNLPSVYETINLLTPHGWVMRSWKVALAGGSAGEVFWPVFVSLGLGLAFFVVGAFLFRRRFAQESSHAGD